MARCVLHLGWDQPVWCSLLHPVWAGVSTTMGTPFSVKLKVWDALAIKGGCMWYDQINGHWTLGSVMARCSIRTITEGDLHVEFLFIKCPFLWFSMCVWRPTSQSHFSLTHGIIYVSPFQWGTFLMVLSIPHAHLTNPWADWRFSRTFETPFILELNNGLRGTPMNFQCDNW